MFNQSSAYAGQANMSAAEAQQFYAGSQTSALGTKRATLTEKVAEAHDAIEHISKLVSGLETRLGPVLAFAQPASQVGNNIEGVVIEPALLDEVMRLVLRMRDTANRIDEIERRVRI